MTAKRLQKEWDLWLSDGECRLDWHAGEREYWTLAPRVLGRTESGDLQRDLLNWTAVLRPARGPLQGARLAWHLDFGEKKYPFHAPMLRHMNSGAAREFEDLDVNLMVMLRPEGCDESDYFVGRVSGKSQECVSIAWNDPEHDGPPPCLNIAQQRDETKDWINGLSGVFVIGGTIFHPFVGSDGAICKCGLKDPWSPHRSITSVLAFLRTAVEDIEPEGQKPVPHGCESAQMMCFCTLDPEAAQMCARDSSEYLREARARFFGEYVTFNLRVVASFGDDLEIECADLGGNIVAKLTFNPVGVGPAELHDMVRECMALTEGEAAFRLLLGDGTCLESKRSGLDLRALLCP